MRRSAFTLIELLTVISIIIILMGMLFPIISMVRSHTKRVKTIAILNQLDAACTQYKLLGAVYPDADAISQVLLPGGTGTAGLQANTITDAQWNTVSNALLAVLQTVDRDNFNSLRYPSGTITDAWNNAIRYRPVRYYPYAASPGTINGVTIQIDANPPPHQDSYQAWSKGANEIDEFGTNDDITNWQ